MPLSWFQQVGQRRKLRLQVHPALSVLRQLAQATVGAITVTGSGPWTITVPFDATSR